MHWNAKSQKNEHVQVNLKSKNDKNLTRIPMTRDKKADKSKGNRGNKQVRKINKTINMNT